MVDSQSAGGQFINLIFEKQMKSRTLKSDLLLLVASVIWGFAFVAQRVGMEFIGPFLFNGIRFALGGLALLPILLIRKKRAAKSLGIPFPPLEFRLLAGVMAGFAVFAGASLQQIGLVYTTAGKAGFITGLYVLIVPILGVFLGKPSRRATWIGAILAVAGLYLLSVKQGFTIEKGDLLVLIGAFFWAGHVQLIDGLVSRMDVIELAFYQFMVCAALSLLVAVLTEPLVLSAIRGAAIPILYAGLLSVGVAYTLQVVGQQEAHPSHAAIILSLEAVFAVLGGWLILNEHLLLREALGCLLMLSGMLFSQVGSLKRRPRKIT